MDGHLRWCSSCTKRQPVATTDLGLICCTRCGKVVDQDIFSSDPIFEKNAAGQSKLGGNIVWTVQGETPVSRERTLNKAYDFISDMADYLGVGGGDQIARPAVRFYEIAVEKNFVRGRKADQVAAACLYIACRDNNKPFLLIEFSEFLRVNVYVLGAVFLQLCKVLHLQEHPIVQKPVDPSLFIHRFANGLLGEINHDVEKTALRIMTSMKRDWMQTGRKPSGLCGAALYISALSHGFKFSKADIVRIVHICEATLTKRLIEFEGTESGSLTIDEFNKKAEEHERNYNPVKLAKFEGSISEVGELLCEHRGRGHPHFAHGLCETCYSEFIRISGGLDGGSEPPAFQRAEQERLAKACVDEGAADLLLDSAQVESSCNNTEMENRMIAAAGGINRTGMTGVTTEHEASDMLGDKSGEADCMGTEGNESDNFSDIDDDEVNAYLHNEEEQRFKKIIWEEVNREYLQEQADKEAAAAKAREAYMANFKDCSPEELARQELIAATAVNYAKSKKERQQKRAAEAKTAQTAAEAAHQMLTKKRISSKLNHDRLKELFDDHVISDNPKKGRTDKDEVSCTSKGEAEVEDKEDKLETIDEYEERNTYEDYQDDLYYDDEEHEEFDDGLF